MGMTNDKANPEELEVNPDDLEVADELIAERRAEAPGETPEDMTPWQRPITAAIDVINYRAGQIIALMMVPLIAVVVLEVISRNSFAILQDAGFEDFLTSVLQRVRDPDLRSRSVHPTRKVRRCQRSPFVTARLRQRTRFQPQPFPATSSQPPCTR